MKGSSNSVLIIGGGAAGCAAAAELSRRGVPSTIVEAADRLGGLAGSHCCKSTERCERCDACLPMDVRRDALNAADVTVMTSSLVVDARMDDGLVVSISGPGGREEARFGSVIVAIGAMPFDPALDPRLGYGSVPGVLSSLEVDQRVRDGTFIVPGGTRIAVILCVGSRDVRRGAPYCSKVCCKYGYQLARHLQTARPGLDVTFLYMDWRPLDGWRIGAQWLSVSPIAANDANSVQAPGYGTLALSAGYTRQWGAWRLNAFARIDNVADRQYVGSVIVNEGNGRFYEPAPGRQWMAGLGLTYAF